MCMYRNYFQNKFLFPKPKNIKTLKKKNKKQKLRYSHKIF